MKPVYILVYIIKLFIINNKDILLIYNFIDLVYSKLF